MAKEKRVGKANSKGGDGEERSSTEVRSEGKEASPLQMQGTGDTTQNQSPSPSC